MPNSVPLPLLFLDSAHHICAPVSVIHGSVTFALTVSSERPLEGSVVTVSCDEGYVPYQGVNVYTCGREGVWQPQSPGCGGERSVVAQKVLERLPI